MKKTNKKIIAIISILIIIAGIVMIIVKGFNFDLKYQDSKRIILSIGQTFNISDIKQITDEVFGNEPVMIQKVEVFEDAVSIIAKDITDEQKTNIVNKINEKYGTETTAEEVELTDISHTRGRDIIKPYIMPIVISTIVIVVYMMIRYYKLNSIKVLVQTIAFILYTQILLFSIIAITRIPIGRFTIPLGITVYMLTLVGVTTKFENKLKKKAEEKEEK